MNAAFRLALLIIVFLVKAHATTGSSSVCVAAISDEIRLQFKRPELIAALIAHHRPSPLNDKFIATLEEQIQKHLIVQAKPPRKWWQRISDFMSSSMPEDVSSHVEAEDFRAYVRAWININPNGVEEIAIKIIELGVKDSAGQTLRDGQRPKDLSGKFARVLTGIAFAIEDQKAKRPNLKKVELYALTVNKGLADTLESLGFQIKETKTLDTSRGDAEFLVTRPAWWAKFVISL